jgi:hypothetical protein
MLTSLLVNAPKSADVPFESLPIPNAQICMRRGIWLYFHAVKPCLDISDSYFHPELAIMQSC